MPEPPSIIHADLDAFFASVEQRDDPRLRGKPVAVGGGVVLAASYEARAFGIKGGMGGGRARALCPDVIFVRPRMEAYSQASKAVQEVFRDTAPVVEAISIDEAFLDVRGLDHISGSPPEIARKLRRRVRREVGLPLTVGVARTKHLAKVASAAAKPDGLLVVAPEEESAFLHPLPVEAIWGVGAITARKLRDRGITTVGELAAAPERMLVDVLGRAAGRHLHALANNRDPRRVRSGQRRRSIGSQRALGRRGPRSPGDLDAILVGIVDRVARRLRTGRRVCRTVVLRLRFGDYTRATRSHTMWEATASTAPILATARALLADSLPLIQRHGLTLIGLSLSNLEDDRAVQLALPFDGRPAGALDEALDGVRDRFGSRAIVRAVLLDHDDRSMPVLPDQPP